MVAETETTQTITKKHSKSLFQDAITVEIPITVTADLGIAIRRTRKKRIAGILLQFPSLKKKEDILETKDEAEEGKEGDDEKKEVDANVPQRHQYGSVIDYLEAKYARGVMLQDEGDDGTTERGGGGEEEDNAAGSVYDSDGSFLDDSLLQRDVAEQVITQATHTKLGMEEDDADFFVNVGTLEVEDHDLMDYDPVMEEKISKKRKLEGGSKKVSTKKLTPKKSKTDTIAVKTIASNTTTDAPKSSEKPTTNFPKSKAQIDKSRTEILKHSVDALEKSKNQQFHDISKTIRNLSDDVLPKRKTMEKVSIVVPAGKSAGDDVTFSNPHVPGQKLRVKVPKNAVTGGKFVVSVPVPQTDDGVDRNKFGRQLQEALSSFSQTYDEWCTAQAIYKESINEKFHAHHERMNKFNELMKVFPKDLMTIVDGPYLRKIVRRARQAAAKRANKEGVIPERIESAVEQEQEEEEQTNPKQYTIVVPGKGKYFKQIRINLDHFEQPEQDAEDQALRDAKAAKTTTSTTQNSSRGEEMTSISQTGVPKQTVGISKDASMISLNLPCKGKVFPKKRVLTEDFLDEQDG